MSPIRKTKYLMAMIMSVVGLVFTIMFNCDAKGKVVDIGTTLTAVFAWLTATVYFLFSFIESTGEK